jgi:large subunit ribosomal protein L30e
MKVIRFNGNSLELGAACGRPFSVNSLAIIESGNSKILDAEYA